MDETDPSKRNHETDENPEAKGVVVVSLERIHHIYARVKEKLGLSGPEAIAETDKFLVEAAEKHEEVDDAETALVEGSLEAVGEVQSDGPNPIDSLEKDGFDALVTEAVEELAEEEATLPTGESVAEVVVGHIEIAGMSPEQQVELATEKTVEALGLSEADQQRYIEQLEASGASELEITISNRSFENTRFYLQEYFDKLIRTGIRDEARYEKESKEERKKLINTRLKAALAETQDAYLLEIIGDNKIETMEDLDNLKRSLDLEIEKIRSEYQRKSNELNEKFRSDQISEEEFYEHATSVDYEEDPAHQELTRKRTKLADLSDALGSSQGELLAGEGNSRYRESAEGFFSAVEGNYGEAADIDARLAEKYRTSEDHRLSPQEAMQTLQEALTRLQINGYEIIRNSEVETLTKFIEQAKIKSLGDVTEEELKFINQLHTLDRKSSDREGYLKIRRPIEAAMGFPTDGVVYGTLAEKSEINEGETHYGNCCTIFEPSKLPEVFFTAGDSATEGGLGFFEQGFGMGYDRGESVEGKRRTVKARQFIFEHAKIIKSMMESLCEVEHQKTGKTYSYSSYCYIEAQFIGNVPFDTEHVKHIRIVNPDASDRKVLESLRDHPMYEKIQIINT